MVLIKEIYCKCCGCVFYICQSCYKGHQYCSQECKESGYRENHRKAQKRYQESTRGKKNRSKAAKKRRIGKKKREGLYRKLMKTCICIMMLFTKNKNKNIETGDNKVEKCKLCGKEGIIVEKFPIRSYKKMFESKVNAGIAD